MSTAERLIIELLDTTRHDRSTFFSGVEALDRYLQSQAGQDARQRVAAPYVLLEPPSPNVIGFYTLSNTSVRTAELPVSLASPARSRPAPFPCERVRA